MFIYIKIRTHTHIYICVYICLKNICVYRVETASFKHLQAKHSVQLMQVFNISKFLFNYGPWQNKERISVM